MNDFEKLYYEEESFWEGEMLQDPANQERIKITADLIPAKVVSLADIGCGNGIFVNYLNKSNPAIDLIAVDRSETALKYVQVKKQVGDIAAIPLPDRSVDCVTCLEVIEHLPLTIYRQALAELARISKEYVIISVPYKENLEEQHNQCPSCKTIFNYELHLRNFDDDKMRGLLTEFGFSCTHLNHLGASYHYYGHSAFRKLFYKEQFRQWRSPICPLCGYQKEKAKAINGVHGPDSNMEKAGKRKLISYLSGIPKLIWPKVKKNYWVIGLYKRS
jgi:ubiquinone/menaquinone biosynthesis C-methylase UbiE